MQNCVKGLLRSSDIAMRNWAKAKHLFRKFSQISQFGVARFGYVIAKLGKSKTSFSQIFADFADFAFYCSALGK